MQIKQSRLLMIGGVEHGTGFQIRYGLKALMLSQQVIRQKKVNAPEPRLQGLSTGNPSTHDQKRAWNQS